jgi:hypothetical protein
MKKSKKTVKKMAFVIPIGNGWAVKASINGKYIVITDNKKDAVSVARDIAKSNESDLIIYGKNGSIISTNSYTGKRKPMVKV